MFRRVTFLAFHACTIGLIATAALQADQDATAEESAIKKVVNTYQDRMKSGDSEAIDRILDLFVNSQAPVLSFGNNDAARDLKPLTAAQFVQAMKFFAKKSGPIRTRVESLKVEMVSPTLAVATVLYSNTFVKGRTVLTLRADAQYWKILALVTESTTLAQDQK